MKYDKKKQQQITTTNILLKIERPANELRKICIKMLHSSEYPVVFFSVAT